MRESGSHAAAAILAPAARAARALAAVRGRSFVLPDDAKTLARVILPHRLILSSQTRLRGRDATAIVDEILGSVAAPVLE